MVTLTLEYLSQVRASVSTIGGFLVVEFIRGDGETFKIAGHDLPDDRARAIADAINGKGKGGGWSAADDLALSNCRLRDENEKLSAENKRLRTEGDRLCDANASLRKRVAELGAAAADACAVLRGES